MGNSLDIIVDDVAIAARDGYQLAATLYRPLRLNGPAVLINPATGVPRRYYDAFARYLAGQGMGVLCYDYRGTGQSLRGAITEFDGDFLDWGQKDFPGAVEALADAFPGAPLALVGHSGGGQFLGLAEQGTRIRAVWNVAAQSGWWGHWPWRWRLRLLFNWYLFLPLSTALLGYYPGDWVGSARLPLKVARQWRRFCCTPHYISDARGNPLRPFNDRIAIPMHFTSFSDDRVAPEQAVRALFDYYPAARIEYRHVAPGELGLKQVGHFGYFRKSFPRAEWQRAAAWLMAATAAADLARSA